MTLDKLLVCENLKFLKFLLKEFQFVMSLKILRIMAYNACHVPIPMTSCICYRSSYDVILI